MQRLIIVSNRLPFNIVERKGQLAYTQSTGGLVSCIKSYMDSTNGEAVSVKKSFPLWVGSTDISEKVFSECRKGSDVIFDNIQLCPVFMSKATKDKYYNGFCNDAIWPLFHYFPSYARLNDEYWDEYVNANNAFCRKVEEVYKEGDIIWVHDYHLMLLPFLLREKFPQASIGFFLHIPFPAYELFCLIPNKWRKAILTGILGADLVGFHLNSYVQYFLKSVRHVLGYDNVLRMVTTPERSVTVDAFPVSIDYEKWNEAFDSTEVFSERNRIKRKLADSKIIFSVDRLDYTKGIINRLRAFELFLQSYPIFHKKVVYILNVVPSRDVISKYAENKRELEGLIGKINGFYGSLDWTPVVYQYRSLDFNELCAFYISADVALITPLRDGMNLVAKEFVASRKDKRGVLILSETAGSSVELGESVIVNPYDIKEIAGAILRALNMPLEEQMERNAEMQKRIMNYNVKKWAKDFISQLGLCKAKQEKLNVKEIAPHNLNDILAQYKKSKHRVIFLDYDGTLVPFARFPQLAIPDKELLALLSGLASDPCNTVILISGRDKEILEEWFRDVPINLVAEHGACYRSKDNQWYRSGNADADWKKTVEPVMSSFVDRCAGTFIEEKSVSLAWHYRNAERELGFLRSRQLIDALTEFSTHLNFQVLEGNKVVEARTRGVSKGTAAITLMENHNFDFVLAIGDDRTDEDLFKVLPDSSITIKVGLMQSTAKYNFKYQKEVPGFLNLLSDLK